MSDNDNNKSSTMTDDERTALVELRNRFFTEYRAQIESGKFNVEDIRRFRRDDDWALQFLRRCDLDLDVTLPVVFECLKWRQDFGVHQLSPLRLRTPLEKQVMYIHGKDLQDIPILWFHVRNHKKDVNESQDAQSLIVYWLEKHNRELKGEPLVIVFDMSSTGLQNMDLDLIKFLLHCLKYYFPGLLAYLLVYDIPWVLNAAWKLVKTWLDSAAQKKIIFVNKDSVKDHVHSGQLPKHMGGLVSAVLLGFWGFIQLFEFS